MKYNSKHRYTKDGKPNLHFKYNIKYIGIDDKFHIRLFKHRRNVEKHGFTYIRKVYKCILHTVDRDKIPQIKVKKPKIDLSIEPIYFINSKGKSDR